MAKPIHTRICASVLCAATLVSPDAAHSSSTLPQEFPSWCAAGPPELRTAADDVLSGVAGAHRFEHGGIVVASAGPHELRFYDAEGQYIARRVLRYGNIAHVWSTYEFRIEPDGPVRGRGVNSFQLIFMEDR